MSDSCDLMDCSLPGSSVHGVSRQEAVIHLCVYLLLSELRGTENTGKEWQGGQALVAAPALQSDLGQDPAQPGI